MMQTILQHRNTLDHCAARVRQVAARTGLAAFAAAMVVTAPVPANAQDTSAESRLRKIEAEVRALQRSVFPGGDGRYFEPQIAPGDPATPVRSTGPSTTAVTDILARLDALELQLQSLTARTEEATNSMAMLDTRIAALEARGGPVVSTDTVTTFGTGTGSSAASTPTPTTTITTTAIAPSSRPAATTAPVTVTAAATGPSAERLAAVKAIAKPQTDDAADDEYSYGFRLWDAKFFPEARQQLTSFVDAYQGHWRQTYAMNLLGRAYLDDGMTEEAARWFLKNYQSDRTAARAPDSLLYLAESMITLGDTRRACIALAEFADTYPIVASGRLSDQYRANRGRVTCEG